MSNNRWRLFVGFLLACLVCAFPFASHFFEGAGRARADAKGAAKADQASHPITPGFERFFSEEKTDAVRGGRLLLGDLNCTSCHKAENALGAVVPKQAPILTKVSARIKPDFLRKFLADPHAVKPGTTMPNLFGGDSGEEKKSQIEALVHYLASLGAGAPEQEFPTLGAHRRGEELFHRVGCAACHASRTEGAVQLAGSAPLPNLLKKYTLPSLTRFLLDPLHVRPSGRMPSLSLSSPEARDIASYLLKGLPEVAHLQFSYYEGSWNALPDFSKLTPKATGGTDRIDETLKQRSDQFGLRFEGFLRIDKEGEYTFTLGSDDGSRLTLDGELVVNVDGTHPYQKKSGKTRLKAGIHEVVIDFFEQGGQEKLTAEFEGPGIRRQLLAPAMSTAVEAPRKENLAVDVKPPLVQRGRRLFATLGCASCHEVKEQGKRVVSKLTAASLNKLKPREGCLAVNLPKSNPPKRIPQYRLSQRQRVSLAAAIEASRGKIYQPTPIQTIDQTLTAFNCYACHKRNKIGGVEEARDGVFQTTMKEMGDEGRIPPDLDGAGAKLTALWLKHIFAQGANDRPYMHTRMPRYGLENIGHLVDLLQKIDAVEPTAKPEIKLPLVKVKAAGWHMVGNRGFGCVKCHSFGPFKAGGIQAMDMAVMGQRLKEDWCKRYLRNPQLFRRGTRMPSAWPVTGKSQLKDVLDGDVDRQIHAVWLYLSDGKKARTPFGMVTGSRLLTPFNEAIIYRNFIQGAGPRAIAVGYPEDRHLAFDANQMRLALIWQGSYIDAKRHWDGRGQGFEPPAGNGVIKLPAGVAFARLENADAPWPKKSAKELGYRFRGYRLTKDQRPTFLYEFGAIQIEDFPNPIATTTATTLGRTITIKSKEAADNLWFRAAVGGKITAADDGWYVIDSALRIRLKLAGAKAVIRKQGNQFELLLPIKLGNKAAMIAEEFDW